MAYRSHHVMDEGGWTYFILARDVGLVKIGVAKDVWPRFKSIQVCSPVELELVAFVRGRKHEYSFHRLWDEWRVRGEWFSVDAPGLVEYMEDHPFVARLVR